MGTNRRSTDPVPRPHSSPHLPRHTRQLRMPSPSPLADLIDPKRLTGLERLLGSHMTRLNFGPGDPVYLSIRGDPALLILEQGALDVFLDGEPDR
jgi:hypothetical protein